MSLDKPKVSRYVLEDMKKFIPDRTFSDEDYTITSNETDTSVLMFAKAYYAEHYPIPLYVWKRVNVPENGIMFRTEFFDQTSFVTNVLYDMVCTKKDINKNPIMVISTHVSDTVVLPVYLIKTKKVSYIFQSNFKQWKVSVISKIPLTIDFMRMFDEDAVIQPLSCEGFPNEYIFRSYNENNRKFTVELANNHMMYNFFLVITRFINNSKK